MEDYFITPAQLRGARAMLDWSRERCRRESNVSADAIRDLEAQRRKVSRMNIRKLVNTFALHGVVFVGLDGVILLSSKADRAKSFMTEGVELVSNDVREAVTAIYASAPPLM